MFRGPEAVRRGLVLHFSSQSRRSNTCTCVHLCVCLCVKKKERNGSGAGRQTLTFGAHDEVVNVGAGGHARALAALLNHSSRGHHFHVDHLRKRGKQNSVR